MSPFKIGQSQDKGFSRYSPWKLTGNDFGITGKLRRINREIKGTTAGYGLQSMELGTSPTSASVNEPENDQQDDSADRGADDGGDDAGAEMNAELGK